MFVTQQPSKYIKILQFFVSLFCGPLFSGPRSFQSITLPCYTRASRKAIHHRNSPKRSILMELLPSTGAVLHLPVVQTSGGAGPGGSPGYESSLQVFEVCHDPTVQGQGFCEAPNFVRSKVSGHRAASATCFCHPKAAFKVSFKKKTSTISKLESFDSKDLAFLRPGYFIKLPIALGALGAPLSTFWQHRAMAAQNARCDLSGRPPKKRDFTRHNKKNAQTKRL